MGFLKTINGLFSGGPYYIRISRTRLNVRDASNGAVYDDEPLVAISPGDRPTILAIGSAASGVSENCVNPFAHPRLVIDDFQVAEKLLLYAFKQLAPNRFLAASPIAVIHVIDEFEGGLGQIERRAMLELAEGAGARRAYLWEGRELTDQELRAGVYRSAI